MFAANADIADNPDYTDAVKGAAVSAINKALGTLTIAIRETIDRGFKTVKDAMKINPDSTSLTIDNQTLEAKNK
ncbi:variable large family protein (plasmid) [Borrelia puertoricensis]|uniref:variable large family protein n=1 Tax=Borrelia puertoricensis TaxID=2756107 RepID=UPI003EBFA373